MKKFLKEFKEFAVKGNIIELAIAVVIGVAFNALVDSFVKDIVMQLIAAILKQPDFSHIVLTYNGIVFMKIGNFINQIINFVIVAFSIFIAIKSLHKLTHMRHRNDPKPIENNNHEEQVQNQENKINP